MSEPGSGGVTTGEGVPGPESLPDDGRPLVISLCGTYLKREMQSLYRQIANLRDWRTAVFAEQLQNLDLFPFDPVVPMEKRKQPRHRGNFLVELAFLNCDLCAGQ